MKTRSSVLCLSHHREWWRVFKGANEPIRVGHVVYGNLFQGSAAWPYGPPKLMKTRSCVVCLSHHREW